jgi:predicted glycosyltransferase
MGNGRYLFVSHDGFGLGHVRRNLRIATALLRREPDAEITVVTGIESKHAWLDRAGVSVVRVPALVKDSAGQYRNGSMTQRAALEQRSARLLETVATFEPNVVVVDRHPFGLAGEWRAGLSYARVVGSQVMIGLRDVLDEPSVVRSELSSERWNGTSEIVDGVLVYGSPVLCDHESEYGLPFSPVYCGWVGEALEPTCALVDDGLLVVAAGGGGDGAAVAEIGCGLAGHPRVERVVLITGPAGADRAEGLRRRFNGAKTKVHVVSTVPDCMPLFAQAGMVLEMAGYNSTIEALWAGSRPILMPRRAPRREQAIRASRLASLGLVDVVDFDAQSDEISWLLDRPRRLAPNALANSGIDLCGADNAACHLMSSVGVAA